MADCITIEVGGIIFGDPEPDGDGIIWTWSNLDGWWTPPAPILSTLELAQGTEVCSSLKASRHLTFDGFADTSSDPEIAYAAALVALGAFDALIDTSGLFVVNEPTPSQVTVWLADEINPRRVLERQGVTFQIQLRAPDPTKVPV